MTMYLYLGLLGDGSHSQVLDVPPQAERRMHCGVVHRDEHVALVYGARNVDLLQHVPFHLDPVCVRAHEAVSNYERCPHVEQGVPVPPGRQVMSYGLVSGMSIKGVRVREERSPSELHDLLDYGLVEDRRGEPVVRMLPAVYLDGHHVVLLDYLVYPGLFKEPV